MVGRQAQASNGRVVGLGAQGLPRVWLCRLLLWASSMPMLGRWLWSACMHGLRAGMIGLRAGMIRLIGA